ALEASAVREQEQREQETPEAKELAGNEGGTGQRAGGDEGKMGSLTSKNTDDRYSLKDDKDNKDLMLSRQTAIDEARSFGMIGMLASMESSAGPTAPWGAEVATGRDDQSFLGNMWGKNIGEA